MVLQKTPLRVTMLGSSRGYISNWSPGSGLAGLLTTTAEAICCWVGGTSLFASYFRKHAHIGNPGRQQQHTCLATIGPSLHSWLSHPLSGQGSVQYTICL